MDHEDAANDQQQPQKGGRIQFLPEIEIADPGNQHDTQTRPDRIHDPNGHIFQRQSKQIERHGIRADDNNRRPEPRELLAGLQRRRADGLCDHGDDEIEIMFGHSF